MKKIIIILCLLTFVVTNKIFAQNWSNYLQFDGGFGLAYDGIDGYLLQSEYGKTYKWLDLGLSLAYKSQYKDTSGDINMMLNARFDFIKLFKKNSRDSFKIGGSFGFGTNHGDIGTIGAIGAIGLSYDYCITTDISIGTFYKYNFIEMGVAGISVRRNF